MTTPDPAAPVTPDAPAPADPTPPPPDAPPAAPPDAPQVNLEDTGTGNGGDAPPMADQTDAYIPSATSNETPVALPIEYTQYPPPPG